MRQNDPKPGAKVLDDDVTDQPAAPREKLPQARMYLKSARWGFDRLLEKMPSGYEYRFYMIGILAALRAVQHSLDGHDRKLSLAHEKIIAEWWAKTSIRDNPDLQIIKKARDQVLKAGSFDSYATVSQSGIGELENFRSQGQATIWPFMMITKSGTI